MNCLKPFSIFGGPPGTRTRDLTEWDMLELINNFNILLNIWRKQNRNRQWYCLQKVVKFPH